MINNPIFAALLRLTGFGGCDCVLRQQKGAACGSRVQDLTILGNHTANLLDRIQLLMPVTISATGSITFIFILLLLLLCNATYYYFTHMLPY